MRLVVLVGVLALGLAATATSHGADVRMFIRHDVTDYATWRKAYDGFDATRRKLGVTAQAVYRSVDDPNDVTVTHDFASVEKAKTFAASPDLKAAMEKGGVKGTPQIWYATKATK